ncbi:unnamed protein product [Lepidochelys kempii]
MLHLSLLSSSLRVSIALPVHSGVQKKKAPSPRETHGLKPASLRLPFDRIGAGWVQQALGSPGLPRDTAGRGSSALERFPNKRVHVSTNAPSEPYPACQRPTSWYGIDGAVLPAMTSSTSANSPPTPDCTSRRTPSPGTRTP